MERSGDGSKERLIETADYIRTLAGELRTMADKADLSFLAYLLSMVENDAHATVRRLSAGEGDS